MVAELARSFPKLELYYHIDYGNDAELEASAVDQAFINAAKLSGVQASIHRFWDRTLVHPEDLPRAWMAAEQLSEPPSDMGVEQIIARLHAAPRVMTDFRKQVQESSPVRQPVAAPFSLPGLPEGLHQAAIPKTVDELYAAAEAHEALDQIKSLTGASFEFSSSHPMPLKGGESQASCHLQHFLGTLPSGQNQADESSQDGPPLAGFGAARMLATGFDNSAKLSAFLNFGCLSPRQVHAELQAAGKVDSSRAAGAKWLTMHLQIRDFFQYMHLNGRGSPEKQVRRKVPEAAAPQQQLSEAELFKLWCSGRTGIPFVDASMRQLAATGYMSNRSRQNVASFLTKGLGVRWEWGESLFRCLLVDFDAASNEGNWQYVAGVDLDPRAGNRVFRTVSQGLKYDPDAELAREWLPELCSLNVEHRHQPWLAEDPPAGYPRPLLPPATQLRREDQQH